MSTNSQVCIPREQADLHRTTEAAALFIGAPLLIWAATRDRPLNQAEKLALGAFAVATLYVDGLLWSRYRKLA